MCGSVCVMRGSVCVLCGSVCVLRPAGYLWEDAALLGEVTDGSKHPGGVEQRQQFL